MTKDELLNLPNLHGIITPDQVREHIVSFDGFSDYCYNPLVDDFEAVFQSKVDIKIISIVKSSVYPKVVYVIYLDGVTTTLVVIDGYLLDCVYLHYLVHDAYDRLRDLLETLHLKNTYSKSPYDTTKSDFDFNYFL